MSQNQFEGLYFAMPFNTNKYHIFKDGRSVCGRWLLFGRDKELCVDVKGTEKLGNSDCKACFKKSGLLNKSPQGDHQ